MLRTVRVPEGMEALFARAEDVVSSFFRERQDHPERGTIEIFGERYLLVRAASLSVEFFTLVRELYGKSREAEADDFARNILFDLAHAIGKQDAQNFHDKMKLDDPIARLSAGPVHFSHSGWAFVDISPASRPGPGAEFYLLYDHPYSFESDAWLHAGKNAAFPVCIMNAGYSSGWCEASFELTLVATEVLCRARGDETCRFIMAPPAAIEDHVTGYLRTREGARDYQIPDFFSRKRVEDDLRRRFAEEIAEREKAEQQLRQVHKLEAVGRLAGGIAHDFNNLMAIVIARASILVRKVGADDPMVAELQQIIAAGERASGLTRQLLAFSRAQVLVREPLELDAVVTELVRLLGAAIGERVDLAVALAAPAAWIEVDRGQLEQVITNLVVNARDAMPGGGRLTVATSRRRVGLATAELAVGDYVVLAITDEGHGMSPETLARVFEPYFTTKSTAQGSGLGLATVYGIVKQSGGTIEVASEEGRGTSFTVMFAETAARPAVVVATTPYEIVPPTPASVLLVEDNASVRAAIAAFLVDDGFAVHEAGSAEDALALAGDPAIHFDVLLTDVILPHVGGFELAAVLREQRPSLPILFMSGYTPDVEAMAAFASAEMLAKPFHPEVLTAKLRELVAALRATR